MCCDIANEQIGRSNSEINNASFGTINKYLNYYLNKKLKLTAAKSILIEQWVV